MPGAPSFHESETMLPPDKSFTFRTLRLIVPYSSHALIHIDRYERQTEHSSMRIHPTLHKSHGYDHPRPETFKMQVRMH